MEWSGSNAENFDQKKQQLTTTARRRCEIERSYTAATAEDTQSGTNKKELELEVYSEGFVYKWYYHGCVNRLCCMRDSHEAACVNLRVCHYSHMALGSPSGQCHMAYIGTPAHRRLWSSHALWHNFRKCDVTRWVVGYQDDLRRNQDDLGLDLSDSIWTFMEKIKRRLDDNHAVQMELFQQLQCKKDQLALKLDQLFKLLSPPYMPVILPFPSPRPLPGFSRRSSASPALGKSFSTSPSYIHVPAPTSTSNLQSNLKSPEQVVQENRGLCAPVKVLVS